MDEEKVKGAISDSDKKLINDKLMRLSSGWTLIKPQKRMNLKTNRRNSSKSAILLSPNCTVVQAEQEVQVECQEECQVECQAELQVVVPHQALVDKVQLLKKLTNSK